MKKIAAVLFAFAMFMGAVYAQEFYYFSANDLEPCAVKEIALLDEDGVFCVFATADKGVTVEEMSEERFAEDGEVFNARVKLNGSGKLEYRSIHFLVEDACILTVYSNSSSKTDARVLALADAETGDVLAEITAIPDDGVEAGVEMLIIADAGEYAIYSKGSGINIYAMSIEY